MIRYPIYVIDGDDLAVYNTPDEHRNELEAYDVEHFGFLFDSDGRVLTASEAGDDRVTISDSGAEPQPEWLRQTLMHLLRRRGQEWSNDAPLESLIIAAQATRLEAPRLSLGQAISNLLRRLRLRRPGS